MSRRRCQYCEEPLGWFAKLLHIYSCGNCAYRLSMGVRPNRPRRDEAPQPGTETEGRG